MNTRDQVDGKFDSLKLNVENVLKSGRESFKEAEKMTLDTLEEVTGQISKVVKKTQSFVRENPAISIAAVIVTGFVIAKLVSTPKSHDQKIH